MRKGKAGQRTETNIYVSITLIDISKETAFRHHGATNCGLCKLGRYMMDNIQIGQKSWSS